MHASRRDSATDAVAEGNDNVDGMLTDVDATLL
jgi:hypothetical protein